MSEPVRLREALAEVVTRWTDQYGVAWRVTGRVCPVCGLPSVEETHSLCAVEPPPPRRTAGLCVNCRAMARSPGYETCARCFWFPEKFRAPDGVIG